MKQIAKLILTAALLLAGAQLAQAQRWSAEGGYSRLHSYYEPSVNLPDLTTNGLYLGLNREFRSDKLISLETGLSCIVLFLYEKPHLNPSFFFDIPFRPRINFSLGSRLSGSAFLGPDLIFSPYGYDIYYDGPRHRHVEKRSVQFKEMFLPAVSGGLGLTLDDTWRLNLRAVRGLVSADGTWHWKEGTDYIYTLGLAWLF